MKYCIVVTSVELARFGLNIKAISDGMFFDFNLWLEAWQDSSYRVEDSVSKVAE